MDDVGHEVDGDVENLLRGEGGQEGVKSWWARAEEVDFTVVKHSVKMGFLSYLIKKYNDEL